MTIRKRQPLARPKLMEMSNRDYKANRSAMWTYLDGLTAWRAEPPKKKQKS